MTGSRELVDSVVLCGANVFKASAMAIPYGAVFYCKHMLRLHSINNNDTIKSNLVPDVHSLSCRSHKTDRLIKSMLFNKGSTRLFINCSHPGK